MRASYSGSKAIANYLLNGYWYDTGQRPHHWVLDQSHTLTVDLSDLNADGRKLARAALDSWENVANLHFKEVSASADISFDDDDSGASSKVWYRNGRITSAEVNIGLDRLDACGKDVGTFTFRNYIHEIGHALGLGHPADYSDDLWESARFRNDSYLESTMSYIGSENPHLPEMTGGHNMSPMLADILAVQMLYGAPKGGPSAGRTVYGQNTNFHEIYGDALSNGKVWYGFHERYNGSRPVIYDVGGIDTIDFSNDVESQRFDLRDGAFSDVYALHLTIGIAHGTIIENYRAGTGGDHIRGNKASNLIDGNNGEDRIRADKGADKIIGGPGADHLYGGHDKKPDEFIYRDRLDSMVGPAHDTIHDFRSGEDLIDFSDLDARPATSATDEAFSYTGTTAAAYSVWWEANSNRVVVKVDLDGNALADLEIFLPHVSSLGVDDFIL